MPAYILKLTGCCFVLNLFCYLLAVFKLKENSYYKSQKLIENCINMFLFYFWPSPCSDPAAMKPTLDQLWSRVHPIHFPFNIDIVFWNFSCPVLLVSCRI